MPSARRHAAPVIVELRPDDMPAPSNIAPSTPPQAKAVRFPVQAEIITGVSRPLTPTEAWSLYHFETHARTCPTCHDPYHVVMNGGRLCEAGHALAYDVAMNCYHRQGQVYSTRREEARDIRVEVPHGYDRLLDLLRAIDRRGRKQKHIAPVVSYDTTTRRAPAVQPVMEEDEYTDAYIEPARSSPRKPHKPRYSTVIIGDSNDSDAAADRAPRKDEKRGSLYEKDMQRPRKEYRVKVREPASERKERRRQTVYYN